MATTLISSNLTNNSMDITNGDEVIIAPGVLIFDENGNVFELEIGNLPTALVNFGTILTGSTSVAPIDLESDTSIVINHGTISHTPGSPISNAAIFDLASGNSSGGAATDTTIVNYGLMESTAGFFDSFSSDGLYNVIIDNLGTIRTDQGVQFLLDNVNMFDVRISNSGTLIGGLLQADGGGVASVDNSGRMEVTSLDMNATVGSLLVNSGDLIIGTLTTRGTVVGSNGFDSVVNSGTLNGNVSLSSDNDNVYNEGLLFGNVTLSDGNDILNNIGGRIAGIVDLGAENDTLNNTGTILGPVFLGDGEDALLNTGTISNTVSAGDDNDTFNNRGLVDGNVSMGAGDDTYRGIGQASSIGEIRGDEGNDTLIGGTLSDTILGGLNDDFLRGMAGDDDVQGGDGQDSILGDGGDDTLNGGAGIDTVRGGDGDDQIDGGINHDELFGNAGNDTILGGTGDDTIRGGAGDDSIEGGDGANNMNGGLGNDTVVGDVGNELMRGNDGNDNLAGADGADTLLGGEGNDTLTGGLGRDVLNGGLGADQFRFTGTAETGIGAARDLIQDFEVGTDLIVLSPLPGVLDFIGDTAFTGTGAEVRATVISGGLNTLVQIDGDGDGTVDAEVLLSFATGVTEDDFLL